MTQFETTLIVLFRVLSYEVGFFSNVRPNRSSRFYTSTHKPRKIKLASVTFPHHNTGAGSHFGVLKGIKIQHFFRPFLRLYSLELWASKYTPFLDVRQAKVTSGIGMTTEIKLRISGVGWNNRISVVSNWVLFWSGYKKLQYSGKTGQKNVCF